MTQGEAPNKVSDGVGRGGKRKRTGRAGGWVRSPGKTLPHKKEKDGRHWNKLGSLERLGRLRGGFPRMKREKNWGVEG